MRIIWTQEKLSQLRECILSGLTAADTAEQLTNVFNEKFTLKTIVSTQERYRLFLHSLLKKSKVRIYKEMSIPFDNYMISCDEHGPYHSEYWVNRKLEIAEKFKIRKNIQIGDFLDFDFMSHWPIMDGEKRGEISQEIDQVTPLMNVLDYFDINYLLCGNHETRVSRITDSRIQAEYIYKIFGAEKWKQKVKYSNYDKMVIGKKWMAVHPKSYSQVATSVAKRLAEKFHKNIINSHGHLVGMAYDRSGEYLAIDLGGMFDVTKIAYISLQTTTHPRWKNGFGMLLDKHFWHFTPETDFSFWLGKK